MLQSALYTSIGKSIYLTGSLFNTNDGEGCIVAHYDTMYALNKNLAADIEHNSCVLHGVITPALRIPELLLTDAFIIVESNNIKFDDFIVKANSVHEMQEIIMSILGNTNDLESTNYDLADLLFAIEPVKIDNIYVMYGYELLLSYVIDERSLNLKTISNAAKTYNSITKN